MKATVTPEGVQIPRHLLGAAKVVEITQENGKVVVTPLPDEDPIWKWGSDPVEDEVTDASVNHDAYLYPDAS